MAPFARRTVIEPEGQTSVSFHVSCLLLASAKWWTGRHLAQVAYQAVRTVLRYCPADCCLPAAARLSGEAVLRSALPGRCIPNVMLSSSAPIGLLEAGCGCDRLDC